MATVGIKGLTFDRHVYFFLEVEECPVGCDHEYKRVKNTPKWSLISLGHILTYDVTLILTFYQTLACFIAEYSSVVSIKSFHGYCGVYKLRTQKHRVWKVSMDMLIIKPSHQRNGSNAGKNQQELIHVPC